MKQVLLGLMVVILTSSFAQAAKDKPDGTKEEGRTHEDTAKAEIEAQNSKARSAIVEAVSKIAGSPTNERWPTVLSGHITFRVESANRSEEKTIRFLDIAEGLTQNHKAPDVAKDSVKLELIQKTLKLMEAALFHRAPGTESGPLDSQASLARHLETVVKQTATNSSASPQDLQTFLRVTNAALDIISKNPKMNDADLWDATIRATHKAGDQELNNAQLLEEHKAIKNCEEG